MESYSSILSLDRLLHWHNIWKDHSYCTSFLFVAILWRMLFIHSLVDRHLGCFYFLAFMMMPYECLCLHFSVDMCLNSLRYTSEGRIARPCGNSVFSITKIKLQNKTKKTPANLFSKVPAAFYILISRVWEFQCLHFSPTLVHFRYYSHCCGMKPFFISGSCIWNVLPFPAYLHILKLLK